MFEFSCCNCGAVISVADDARDKPVVCYNCDTRQPVPANAPTAKEQLMRIAARQQVAPTYAALDTVAGIVVVVGVLECVLAVIFAIAVHGAALVGIATGICTMGFGFGLSCLRDIAIDVWHMRRQ